MTEPKSYQLVQQYQAGHSEAATAIFDRYVQRLLALARTRISPKLRRRIDADDVVQSAYRSFFAHAKSGDYQVQQSGDLWRLLASVTLNKLYGQIEKHSAAKRNIDRESLDAAALSNLTTIEPTLAEMIAVGEQLRLILDRLTSDEREALTRTLQGQSVTEIAAALGKSERTIRRLLETARTTFEQHLLERQAADRVGKVGERAQPVEPQAPLKFADYVLEKLIGSGGMGKVYRALDKCSGKTVAVKALHKARQADHRAVAQFVQESQILARLRHPNIVGVQGLGRFPSGGYFLVMDYVDGVDLQSRLRDGPVPIDEALRIIEQVAEATAHAHAHGIVHCDLKPGNVLVDRAGRAVVTDFGFAFIVAGGVTAGGIGGTAGYMAPEILRLASPPTPAADIYALGALLWTLTTGRLPDPGAHPSLGPPPHIQEICKRCLCDDPARRYPDVRAFLAAAQQRR